MEPDNRNKPKYYVLTYSDGVTPARVVCGWPAVVEARRRSEAKVTAKGFHTEEVAKRWLKDLISGSVTYQNAKKPRIVDMTEAI